MLHPELVTTVISTLIPFAAKGADGFAKEAGKEAFQKVKGLFETLKSRWSADEEASDTLEKFVVKPARYESALRDILEEKLASDENLRVELSRAIQNMGPELEVIQKMKVAKDVTGVEAEEFSSGKVRVEQEIEQADKVTGAKFKKIG